MRPPISETAPGNSLTPDAGGVVPLIDASKSVRSARPLPRSPFLPRFTHQRHAHTIKSHWPEPACSAATTISAPTPTCSARHAGHLARVGLDKWSRTWPEEVRAGRRRHPLGDLAGGPGDVKEDRHSPGYSATPWHDILGLPRPDVLAVATPITCTRNPSSPHSRGRPRPHREAHVPTTTRPTRSSRPRVRRTASSPWTCTSVTTPTTCASATISRSASARRSTAPRSSKSRWR